MKLISLCIYFYSANQNKQQKKNNNNNQSKYVYVRKKDAELSEKEQNNGLQQIVVYS